VSDIMTAGQVPKDMRKVLRELERKGATVTLRGSGHLFVEAPGVAPITVSASPRNPHLSLVQLRKFRQAMT
jgi:hypothetical protein